ncbi:uncharacterized protein LOC126598995 isoform X4 [Malus sylvestris]|uniref:uncharacterized protein LOC126598995 isoform X4 n=1 Tax=Malus sylvestris TaxID=3752 RepID=UPI0021AC2A87|nr:uncharacterized protein LOC126598995 isoform X4 [Malus sylvestris]
MDRSWEQRLVKRYYDKLFKEYCIADMSHYKSGDEAGENKQALVKLVTCQRRKASISASEDRIDDEDDDTDNFEEYLEGMFP